MGEVDVAARVGDGNAVEQDHGGVAIAAAREQIGESAVASGLDDGQAGNVAQQILRRREIGAPRNRCEVKTFAATPASSIATGDPDAVTSTRSLRARV